MVIQAAVLAVAFVVFFRHFFYVQGRLSLHPDWSHAYAVPLVSLYYIHLNRARILAQPVHRNWLGVPLMLFGMAVYFVFWYQATANHFVQGMGMVICLLGLTLFLLGRRMWWLLLFPQLYLLLGVRFPERVLQLVTPTLQRWAAIGSEHLLNILGYTASRSGNVLEVFHNGQTIPLNVAEACSGMRMIVAFMALGVAMAFLAGRAWWQRIVLIGVGIPVAIVINTLRVATIGILATINPAWAAGDAHLFIGTIWLVPALLIYLGFAWILQHLIIVDEDENEDQPPSRGPSHAAATSGSSLALPNQGADDVTHASA